MSWSAALPKLTERLQTLERTHGVQLVYAGVPYNPQVEPFVYFYFSSFVNISQGQVPGNRYSVQIVTGAKWQDSEVSEVELAALVDGLPALFYAQRTNAAGSYTTAVDDDGQPLATLGGTVSIIRLVSAEGILPSDRFPYRGVRWTLEITDKGIT